MREIVGVTGDYARSGAPSAHDDMSVRDVARATCCKQSTNTGGVHPVERDGFGEWLPQEPR